jgi:hypothetical protein
LPDPPALSHAVTLLNSLYNCHISLYECVYYWLLTIKLHHYVAS